MTEPRGNLHNDDVEFQFADDLAPGTGYTPQEIDQIMNTPLDVAEAAALTASGADLDPGFIKLSAEAYGSDRGLREYWTHGEGAAKIRWGTPNDFKRCVRHLSKYVRNPEGLCNEYHQEAVGAPPGKGHDVTTETFATDVAPVARVGSNNPLSVQWEGVLAVEGTETGDGREFSLGSLSWPELPIPLMYQYVTSHGGTTDESTNVGNITEMWRDGKFIKGRGSIDISDPYGLQAARKMKGKYLRGVSIDADSVKEGDVELVFAPAPEGLSEEESLLQMLGGQTPDKTIFHNGRVRGATLVNLPAFVEASLDLIGDTSALDVIVASAVADKFDLDAFADDLALGVRKYIRDKLGRFDDTGPGSTSNETRDLPHVGGDQPGAGYFDRDEEDYELIGDPESDEGAEYRPRKTPPFFTNDKDEDESGFYDDEDPEEKRKRRERRDAALDADYGARVITASAGRGRKFTIEIPELPPLTFFQEPTDLPPIGAMWVEPNGHVYGLVGPSDTPHRSFRNKRVTIPMGNVDYTRWMNRPTLVEGPDGEVLKIRTGVITMNCGHLNAYASSDTDERMKHYDNSCSIAALVRVGESRKHKAPWVAGTILPMSAEDFLRFQACQLSGDWSPHRARRGWKEFVASLAVPVPGFARSTDVAAVRVDDNAVVVASAVPIRLTEDAYEEVDVNETYVPEEMTSAAVESNRLALARIRARLGTGNRQALADIRRRVSANATPLTASAATATLSKEKKVGCAPCAAKARRNGQTGAQEVPVQQVEGYGDGDPVKQAQTSAENAIANTRGTSRG